MLLQIPREISDRYSKPPIGSVVRVQGERTAIVSVTPGGRAFCTAIVKEGDGISKDKFLDPYWQLNAGGSRGLKIFLSQGDSQRLHQNPQEAVRSVKIIAHSRGGRCVFGVVI